MSVFANLIERVFRDALKVENLPFDNVNVALTQEAIIENNPTPLGFLITISFVKQDKLNEVLIKYDIERSVFPTNFPHQLIEVPIESKIENLNRIELLQITSTIDKIIQKTQPFIQKQYNQLFH